jgi:hypothetical protein
VREQEIPTVSELSDRLLPYGEMPLQTQQALVSDREKELPRSKRPPELAGLVEALSKAIEKEGHHDAPERAEEAAGQESPAREEKQGAARYVAERAGYFDEAARGYEGKPHERAANLLADAQHWCDATGVSFEDCLAEAREFHRAEVRELREEEKRDLGKGRGR